MFIREKGKAGVDRGKNGQAGRGVRKGILLREENGSVTVIKWVMRELVLMRSERKGYC